MKSVVKDISRSELKIYSPCFLTSSRTVFVKKLRIYSIVYEVFECKKRFERLKAYKFISKTLCITRDANGNITIELPIRRADLVV